MIGAAAVKPDQGERLEQSFKEAMRSLAGGVVMVTTWVDGRPWGLTVSSCCSISVEPPRIFVSLFRHTQSRQAILDTGTFGINFLSADHKSLAEHGARPGTAKFIDEFCDPKRGRKMRSPMVFDALGFLDCTPARTLEVSDHTLFIGDVRAALAGAMEGPEQRSPLVYFDRSYRNLGGPLR